MDRALINSSAISLKILLCVVVLISLLLTFVPYFVIVIILSLLSAVLVYFDSASASDICSLFASWFYVLYYQFISFTNNFSSYYRKPIPSSAAISPKSSIKMNQMNYVKMKNDMPSPIPREPNLNTSVRANFRNRIGVSARTSLDSSSDWRNDKILGDAFTPPRSSKTTKNSVLTDVTSNYATQRRCPLPFGSEAGRSYQTIPSGNLWSDCDQMYGNLSSPGFSSRVAQCVSELSSSNYSKYHNVGDFPLVHFNQQEPKKLTPNNSQIAAKQRVTVRIAPPVNRSLKKNFNVEKEEKMKSVLEVLKEMSRKRMYSAVEADKSENCKRPRTNSLSESPVNKRQPISPNSITALDITPLGKRIRDTSSDSVDEEVKKKRRQVSKNNNEIKSSLSSSLTITPPHLSKSISTKRKAANEITTADKHFKTSLSPNQSSDASIEKSQSTVESTPERKGSKSDSNSSKNSSRNTNKNQDLEITTEISSDKTTCLSIKMPGSRKDREDSIDSSSSISRNDESGFLRLKPLKNKTPVSETSKEVPKKDILRLPRDWEANPRSLQKTPKNPGKMLKKILCAIEGTDNVNFDSMPAHVKKLLASGDEPDSVDASTASNNKVDESSNKVSSTSTALGSLMSSSVGSSSTSNSRTASSISSTFKFSPSNTKTVNSVTSIITSSIAPSK